MESPQDQQPWTILGLDGATTPTEQEVKRAYAKLIKQHRPDTDPEGFQRVQTAYRAALQIISQSPLPTVVPIETAPPTPTPKVWISAEFDAAESALRAAAERVEHQELTNALEAFRPIMRDNHQAKLAWGSLLAELFESKPEPLALTLPPAGVQRLLEVEQGGLVQGIMVQWHATGRTNSLVSLANGILKNPQVFSHLSQSLTVARLAALLAFYDSATAEKLTNAAFGILPPGPDRDYVMAQIEHRVALGKVFGVVKLSHIPFWETQLCESGDIASLDWNSDQAQRALRYIRLEMSPDWAGFGILHQILPPPVWQKLESDVRERLEHEQRRHQNAVARYSGAQTSEGNVPVVGIIWGIIILLKVIYFFFNSR